MNDRIKVPLRLPPEIHKEFKHRVAKDYTNMNSKMIELIKKYLEENVARD